MLASVEEVGGCGDAAVDVHSPTGILVVRVVTVVVEGADSSCAAGFEGFRAEPTCAIFSGF